MKIYSYLIILCLPVFIFLLVLNMLYKNFYFYQKIYADKNIYQNYQNKLEQDKYLKNVSMYLGGKENLNNNYFSSQAILHMDDVKNLFRYLSPFLIASFSIIMFCSYLLIYNKEKVLFLKSLQKGSILTILLIAVVSSLFLLNFPLFFEKIHKPLFDNNLWLFDKSDNLIKLFPVIFFEIFSIYLASFIITISFIIFLLTKVAIKNVKPTN